MKVLIGDSMHTGSLVGINTEDPECVGMRVEMKDELELRGVPLVSSHKQKGNMETAEEGVYVRRNVAEERLQDINAVLGNKLAI